MENRC